MSSTSRIHGEGTLDLRPRHGRHRPSASGASTHGRQLSLPFLTAITAALGLGASGCDGWLSSGTTIDSAPTELLVSPASFLGPVACSTEDGAARSYVVTLSDETRCDDALLPCRIDADCCSGRCVLPEAPTGEGGAGGDGGGTEVPSPEGGAGGQAAEPPRVCAAKAPSVPLPPSAPRSCASHLVVPSLKPGHAYRARVDVYREPPESLRLAPKPRVQPSLEEAPPVLDVQTGEPVDATWTTRCGRGAGNATKLLAHRSLHLRACEPLSSSSLPLASLEVDARRALGARGCAGIESLEVLPESSALPARSLPCSGEETAVFESGITPGSSYAFRLEALGAEGEVLLGSTCSAQALADRRVEASCTPFSDQGILELRPVALLGAQACTEGAWFDVEVVSPPEAASRLPARLPCGARASLGPLSPGPTTLRLRATSDGRLQAEATCRGEVQPGLESPCSLATP